MVDLEEPIWDGPIFDIEILLGINLQFEEDGGEEMEDGDIIGAFGGCCCVDGILVEFDVVGTEFDDGIEFFLLLELDWSGGFLLGEVLEEVGIA